MEGRIQVPPARCGRVSASLCRRRTFSIHRVHAILCLPAVCALHIVQHFAVAEAAFGLAGYAWCVVGVSSWCVVGVSDAMDRRACE